jgi:GNAT superfamily N-acetyltransferase
MRGGPSRARVGLAINPTRDSAAAGWRDRARRNKGPLVTMPESSVMIRPLAAADQAGWRKLWTDYLAFYETTLSEAIFETHFGRLLGTDPQDYSCLVAEKDGDLVGLAHYLFHRHGWRIENVCYLQDLYVDPTVRGQGVGRKLIAAVYGAADAAGVAQVYWMTNAANTTARQLYDRIGHLTPFLKYQRLA